MFGVGPSRPAVLAILVVLMVLAGAVAFFMAQGGTRLPPPRAAPSEEPVELSTLGGGQRCSHQWVEGVLRYVGDGSTDLELSSPETVAWPEGLPSELRGRFVSVSWPEGLGAVRLTDGDIAVIDGAGGLVAVTGRSYRLSGGWIVNVPFGEPYPRPPDRVAFVACGEPGSVIPT